VANCKFLLNDGTSNILLNDGVSELLMNDNTCGGGAAVIGRGLLHSMLLHSQRLDHLVGAILLFVAMRGTEWP
jgi:hypothetical protein